MSYRESCSQEPVGWLGSVFFDPGVACFFYDGMDQGFASALGCMFDEELENTAVDLKRHALWATGIGSSAVLIVLPVQVLLAALCFLVVSAAACGDEPHGAADASDGDGTEYCNR